MLPLRKGGVPFVMKPTLNENDKAMPLREKSNRRGGVRQAAGPFCLRDNNLTLSLSAVPSTEFTAALLIQAPSSFLCSAQSMFALLIITSDGPKSEKSFLSSIDKGIDNKEDCGLNTSLCTQMNIRVFVLGLTTENQEWK